MKRVFTSFDNFISELLKKGLKEVYQTRFIISTPLSLGKGFVPVLSFYSLLTAEKEKNIMEICLKLKCVYESEFYKEEYERNKILRDIEKLEKSISFKLWKNHFKVLSGALKLDHEHLFVEESLWRKKLPCIRKKQTGKFYGTVFTKCPSCRNEIIFENQISKNCPYCDIEITFDHENVQFVLETK